MPGAGAVNICHVTGSAWGNIRRYSWKWLRNAHGCASDLAEGHDVLGLFRISLLRSARSAGRIGCMGRCVLYGETIHRTYLVPRPLYDHTAYTLSHTAYTLYSESKMRLVSQETRLNRNL